ncbi:propionyl-CoA synthetase [soil metagenome]
MGAYEDAFTRSISDPEGFWGRAAEGISWRRAPERVLDDSDSPFTRWFVGGELNTCYNAVDRHVESGRGEQTALVYDSPVTDTSRRLSYAELRDAVARFAGALAGRGVAKGDTVVIYMPMVPEAVVAMLACARLGAVHSVVFGGFAARELAKRIDDARPTLLVAASCGVEAGRVVEYMPLVDRALELAEHPPSTCVVLQRPEARADLTDGRDLDWHDVVADAEPADCVPVAATDPLYILYTSGTTGRPKGIVRDNGGHAVAMRWSMENVYGVRPGDVWWTYSDVGWVVGHSYIVYAPLLTGCTTVVFEGKPVGTPDAGAFWRVIAEHGVKALFTAPTAFRAIKQADPKGELLADHDLTGFETLFLAGERLDPDTYHWASELLQRPVIDHWWQTETAWAIVANPMGIEPLQVKPGSATKPVPGYDVRILTEDGEPADTGEDGMLTVKLPLPPGTMTTLWNDEERFVEDYFSAYPGYYFTEDGGKIDEDGYVWVLGRVDDVMNVAGHRLSTGAMEEVLADHPDVAEAAVFGIADELKGQVPVGLVVLSAGVERDTGEISAELSQRVRDEVGAIAALKEVCVVDRLPKTRSGKILRAPMRDIADGKQITVPSTIEDPDVLDEVRGALGELASRKG